MTRRVENRFREDESIRNNDGHVGPMLREQGGFAFVAQRARRENRDAVRLGDLVDGRFREGQATTSGGLRRARVTGGERVSSPDDGLERRDRKGGRSHEDDAQGHDSFTPHTRLSPRGGALPSRTS